jgi:plasmid stabilization system protein ParE
MMRYKALYLPSAQRDIEEAVFYIAEILQNPDAAENLLDSIDEKVELLRLGIWKGQPLKNHPGLLFSELDFNWCSVNNYYLFFRVDNEEKIIRVYHFSHKLRGLEHILKESE